ncbi:hypothetical protein YC2023_123475 [Brassica napus]
MDLSSLPSSSPASSVEFSGDSAAYDIFSVVSCGSLTSGVQSVWRLKQHPSVLDGCACLVGWWGSLVSVSLSPGWRRVWSGFCAALAPILSGSAFLLDYKDVTIKAPVESCCIYGERPFTSYCFSGRDGLVNCLTSGGGWFPDGGCECRLLRAVLAVRFS